MRTWLEGLSRRGTNFISQPDGDLGVRLISAMDHGFASGADLVFFLGGDCPGITCSYLEEAEAALAKTDMVITGALDGGYVLLGLRKPSPRFSKQFRGVRTPFFPRRLAGRAAPGSPMSVSLRWRMLTILRATNVSARRSKTSPNGDRTTRVVATAFSAPPVDDRRRPRCLRCSGDHSWARHCCAHRCHSGDLATHCEPKKPPETSWIERACRLSRPCPHYRGSIRRGEPLR